MAVKMEYDGADFKDEKMDLDGDEEQFSTKNIDQNVWLIKLPPSMAEYWASLPPGADLGTLRLYEANGRNGKTITLHPRVPEGVKREAENGHVVIEKAPKIMAQYNIKETSAIESKDTYIFSENQTTGATRMEGKVGLRGDAQAQLSAAYMKLMGERTKAAQPQRATEGHVQTGKERTANDTFKVVKAPEYRGDPLDKRVRMEKEPLQQKLFQLFREHQYYKITDLVAKTDQPQPWLKEVLKEIATYHSKGDYKNLWELKDMYKMQEHDEDEK
eukprot:comp17598_c0_seq1/m.17256 comp17598_c0_seq1/g.17256  ORF comp17598_c0_seq1/g.17256 comp17598_c0_seq1/m.17256 type:complete len:273 (-) comp17598_c0_seq1:428-1246(-)